MDCGYDWTLDAESVLLSPRGSSVAWAGPALRKEAGRTGYGVSVVRGARPQRPKLLVICFGDLVAGGTERVAISLSRQFACRGWNSEIVFPHSTNDESLLGWCKEQGVSARTNAAVVSVVTARHSWYDTIALRRMIRATAPRVVNLHYGGSNISLKDVLAARLAGAGRCIVTVNHAQPWGGVGEHKRRMTALASRLADAIVVISQGTRTTLLAAGVPARKIRVIACGLHPAERPPNRIDARRRLDIPEDAFVVASVARLTQDKGIADLIEAVASIPDMHRRLRLLVVGDGPERSVLERLAVERGLGPRVTFLGRVPSTEDAYAASDVFALPSYAEGFGLVFVEAAFHGIPSIGARVGGVPEVIRDGETGILIPPGDRIALATAIQYLQSRPGVRKILGQDARRRAYQEFTETAMANKYELLFRDLGVK